MPFKDKIIKEMQKCINQFLQNTVDQANSLTDEKHDQSKKAKQKRAWINKYSKVLKPKIRNIYQLLLEKTPQSNAHIVNFYNIVTINQEAVHSQDFEQSYFRTAFYLKSIKKAQFRPNCVILHLIPSNYTFTPIQYSIERFKSLGDKKFYHLACQMQQLRIKFLSIQTHAGRQSKQENNDKIDKYIQSLGDRMFVVKTSSKFALSKSFMELLEYNPEEYSIQAVKYRTSLYEGCSTKNYYQIMAKTLQNVRNLIDLLFDRISLQTFLDSSIVRLKDILYTKSNKKIYAKIKAGMPNPYLTIYQVEEVINISNQLYLQTPYFEGEKRQKLNTLKEQFRIAGINTVKNLLELPPSYLPENQHMVAHYVQKDTESKREGQST